MLSRFALKALNTAPNHQKVSILFSRAYSSSHHSAEQKIAHDLKHLHRDIRSLFDTSRPELKHIADYYFDGSGKSIRPMLICAMSHTLSGEELLPAQRQIALVAEMIHVASLMHDDVIDSSALRRGKSSVNEEWGCAKAVLAGDYVLAVASQALARLGNTRVIECVSQVIEDLVHGELMQFSPSSSASEHHPHHHHHHHQQDRFEHYLAKTYRKTASLIANSFKAVAILATEDEDVVQESYECGRNIGMAFQLVDDLLDFEGAGGKLGKPGQGADLRLGLATAPVLFAASEHPAEMNALIARRFASPGDTEHAFDLVVRRSQGLAKTRELAQTYSTRAEEILLANEKFGRSGGEEARAYLTHLIRSFVNREK